MIVILGMWGPIRGLTRHASSHNSNDINDKLLIKKKANKCGISHHYCIGHNRNYSLLHIAFTLGTNLHPSQGMFEDFTLGGVN